MKEQPRSGASTPKLPSPAVSVPVRLKPTLAQPANNVISQGGTVPLAATTTSFPVQAMSKEDKAVEIARRKEERKQVRGFAYGYRSIHQWLSLCLSANSSAERAEKSCARMKSDWRCILELCLLKVINLRLLAG